jgi:hypothetical protein
VSDVDWPEFIGDVTVIEGIVREGLTVTRVVDEVAVEMGRPAEESVTM